MQESFQLAHSEHVKHQNKFEKAALKQGTANETFNLGKSILEETEISRWAGIWLFRNVC